MNHFTPFLPMTEIAIHTFQERHDYGDIETRLLERTRMRRELQQLWEIRLLFAVPFCLVIATAWQMAP
ncbi:hypothetical protein ACK9YZ_01190 [Rhizobium sp. ZK1]|uniref:hypothetical protein n=1 Tax=Rhizobium sp. ZK1 TaxID=3389872 RepID=UPI0039F6A345